PTASRPCPYTTLFRSGTLGECSQRTISSGQCPTTRRQCLARRGSDGDQPVPHPPDHCRTRLDTVRSEYLRRDPLLRSARTAGKLDRKSTRLNSSHVSI